MILPCYPLKIETEFSKLIDINDVIPHEIQVVTIPDSPGWYEIEATFISVDRTLRQREAMAAIEGINSGWKKTLGSKMNIKTLIWLTSKCLNKL